MFGKFAKAVGFVIAIAGVTWAMRDRFISVTASREPDPPTFRGTSKSVDLIDGVGPVYAERLSSAGLGTLSALVASDPDSVAKAAEVSSNRARTWIDRAAELS